MNDSQALARGTVAGAVGGAIATVAMTTLMEAGQRAGWLGKMPPRRVTEKAEHEVGILPPGPVTDALASVLHLVVGIIAGAGYGAARTAARSSLPGVVEGTVFGLGFWAVNYVGLAPALGVLPPPHRDRPGRPPVMIGAHVVFGCVLGAVVDALEPRRRR